MSCTTGLSGIEFRDTVSSVKQCSRQVERTAVFSISSFRNRHCVHSLRMDVVTAGSQFLQSKFERLHRFPVSEA